MSEERWEQEGVLANLLGMDVDLFFYIDRTHGVFHYVLVIDGRKDSERRLLVSDVNERRLLDGVKQQWDYAQTARELNDTIAMFAFTWRGLRLIFPHLPEEPMEVTP